MWDIVVQDRSGEWEKIGGDFKGIKIEEEKQNKKHVKE